MQVHHRAVPTRFGHCLSRLLRLDTWLGNVNWECKNIGKDIVP